MSELKRLTDITVKWLPLILALLIYWFGVVKADEKQRVETVNIQNRIEAVEKDIDKLEENKADVYTVNIIMNTLNRIDNKLDKLQEQVNK